MNSMNCKNGWTEKKAGDVDRQMLADDVVFRIARHLRALTLVCWRHDSGRASGAIYDPWNPTRASPCNRVALSLWHRR